MSAGTTWRYCITRERTLDGGIYYAIREVYQDADGGLSWTKDVIAPGGESWHEVVDDLARMSSAANGRILDLTLDPPALVKPYLGRAS